MGLESNKELVRRFERILNAADWDALDDILTEDFRRNCQATPDVQVNSREEFKELQRSFLVSFPDQQVTIGMMVAEGDYVAIYGTYKGTNMGPMGDLPATGKFGEVNIVGIFRFEGEKIAELWVEWDNMAMFAQLGLFPPPTPADA